ncbi:hypothetical protein RQP46_007630 [Phenoliferia psychrophenolica]
MASLPTLSSRRHAPCFVATCAYCNAWVDCVDDGAFDVSPGGEPVRRKVECAVCGKRFIVSKGANGKAHSSTSLTIHLPSEVLAIIFSYVNQFPTKSTATLFESSLVSKHWNSCATPFLYRDIKIDEWDWRIKGTLLRTLDASPSLLPHIRSLKANYPRFEDWGNSLLENTASDGYDLLLKSYIDDLDSEQERVEAQRLHDRGEIVPVLWNRAWELARWKTLIEIDTCGASRWMDDRRNGDAGRRAGACELLALVNRCPSLTALRLDNFDFGEVDSDTLEARLPLSLDHLVTLVLNTSRQSPSPLSHILSRIPNIESLDIGDPLPTSDCFDFPRLRVLRLRHPLTADTFPSLVELVEETAESLRTLQVTLKVDLADQLPEILSTATKLEELTLEMPAPPAHPLQPLLDSLASHSSLQRLNTRITLNLAFIQSLPPMLVYLRASAAPRKDAELADVIVALIASKKTRTPNLILVSMGLRMQVDTLESSVKAVKTARASGLEIRLVQ